MGGTGMKKKGLLIAFDGVDSCGKETQAHHLAERLRYQGRVVYEFTTPDYETKTGKELKLRLQGKLGDWDNTPWEQKMKLFADNRLDHKDEVVAALKNGEVVIYDRYVPSSQTFITVEGAVAGEVEREREKIQRAVAVQEYEVNGMPREDISVFLDVPPEVAGSLLEKRKEKLADDDEYTDHISVQKRLYNEYDLLTKADTKRFLRVQCVTGTSLLGIEATSELVWEGLTARIPSLRSRT